MESPELEDVCYYFWTSPGGSARADESITSWERFLRLLRYRLQPWIALELITSSGRQRRLSMSSTLFSDWTVYWSLSKAASFWGTSKLKVYLCCSLSGPLGWWLRLEVTGKMSLSVQRSIVEYFYFNGKKMQSVQFQCVAECLTAKDVCTAVGYDKEMVSKHCNDLFQSCTKYNLETVMWTWRVSTKMSTLNQIQFYWKNSLFIASFWGVKS